MKRFFLACVLAAVAIPAWADTVMAFVSTDATEWIGMGQTKTYTPTNAVITLTGNRQRVQMRIVGTDGKTWDLRLKAPVGEDLRPKEFFNAEHESFETGRAPSMDFSGDGRACGDVYGDFQIRQIAFDSAGRVTLLEAAVQQWCNSEDAPPLAVVVMYRVPRLSFSMKAPMTDYVGQGIDYIAYGDTTTFDMRGGTGGFTLFVQGMGLDWMVLMSTAYNEQQIKKGTYLTYRSATGNIGGLEVDGNGRGDNVCWGKYEVLTVSYRPDGELAQLSMRYWIYSDEFRTKLSRSGGINYWK